MHSVPKLFQEKNRNKIKKIQTTKKTPKQQQKNHKKKPTNLIQPNNEFNKELLRLLIFENTKFLSKQYLILLTLC